MAKLPTLEEMAQNVAEKVFDEYEYKGRTLREWIEIILATDTNVATKVGTNLASLGTDCISRQAAIDALRGYLVGKRCPDDGTLTCRLIENEAINKLPPIQPKRGKWIKTARWGRVYYCDQCRNYLDFDGVNAGRGSTNYCPNCGCRMDGGE